jgi:hypothetical protein
VKWLPDVVVRDELDFGATLIVERLGIPHVAATVMAAAGLIRPDPLTRPLDGLHAEHELTPEWILFRVGVSRADGQAGVRCGELDSCEVGGDSPPACGDRQRDRVDANLVSLVGQSA